MRQKVAISRLFSPFFPLIEEVVGRKKICLVTFFLFFFSFLKVEVFRIGPSTHFLASSLLCA